jgi:hypothetical protein
MVVDLDLRVKPRDLEASIRVERCATCSVRAAMGMAGHASWLWRSIHQFEISHCASAPVEQQKSNP